MSLTLILQTRHHGSDRLVRGLCERAKVDFNVRPQHVQDHVVALANCFRAQFFALKLDEIGPII
ncbi:MAG: hypothetical protein SH820_10125 [Xanthomonadales bacterium]|nr:hypothetical protein [Xanthomonadales bacterium]